MSSYYRNLAESAHHYQPGDIIFRLLEPLVHVTKYEHRLFTCDQCFRSVESLLACVGCRKVYYCSKECQKKAWTRLHHLECPILSKHKPMQFENQGIDYMQRLTLRLYLLLSTYTSTTSSDIETTEERENILKKPFTLPHNGQQKTIEQMETHSEQLKDSDQFQGIINYFKFYQIENYDPEFLLRCYGLLHINTFGIDCYDIKNLSIEHRGTGLYLEASVFDHSCVPNACASGDGLVLEIRALAPIKPGQIIYLDYIQDVLPRQQRIKHLQDRYFFTCQCELGCQLNSESPAFDAKIDFKRYQVLNNLVESITTEIKRNDGKENNWKQLYDLWHQRLTIQEQYYAASRYHPCLSLFYQSFLRFLILNHRELELIEPELNRIMMKVREHLAITHGREHQFYQWIIGQY